MKALQTVVAMAVLAFAFAACGGGDSKGSGSGGEEKKAVTVSAEMTAFMGDLKGTSKDVEAALAKHGVEGLDKKDMDMYDLNSPEVVKSEADCYTMDAKAGMTIRTYVLCWKGGKIATVEDKGMR